MGKIFLYLAAHPVVAIVGWIICGMIPSRIPRLIARTGVLAVVFSPTVAELPNGTQLPVSAITALYYDLPAYPKPLIMIAFVWFALALAAWALQFDDRSGIK